jgi:hypothetical protein
MTAIPCTAATRDSTSRRAKLLLLGSQREPAWLHPTAAVAAQPTLARDVAVLLLEGLS